MTGYLHKTYASSLKEFGRPLKLKHSQGWILKRQIPGTPYYDAMGCYPIFSCRDWLQLPKDLDEAGDSLVALSLVTDPFGNFDFEQLQAVFPEVCIPFKNHFVANLKAPLESFVDKHHKRNIRKALEHLTVEQVQNPQSALEPWTELYDTLIERHRISGIARFSAPSFKMQLRTPGLVMFKALHKTEIAGMALFYLMNNIAYYHLAAYNESGYRYRASYAIFYHALSAFQKAGVSYVNFGAGAGVENNGSDGLSRFKKGWSNETRTAYFCGKVFNAPVYHSLHRRDAGQVNYFPAYRVGEFA